jgi:hypothetical protein
MLAVRDGIIGASYKAAMWSGPDEVPLAKADNTSCGGRKRQKNPGTGAWRGRPAAPAAGIVYHYGFIV